MKFNRATSFALLTLLGVVGYGFPAGQAWKEPYEKAIKFAKAAKWADSRNAFKQAIADRPEDEPSGGIRTGTLDEPGRSAQPYSANFGAAYAAYKMAQASEGEEATALYTIASQELEVLVGKNRAPREAYQILSVCYIKLGRNDEAKAFDTQWKAAVLEWKSDLAMMTDEDRKIVSEFFKSGTTPAVPEEQKAPTKSTPAEPPTQVPMTKPSEGPKPIEPSIPDEVTVPPETKVATKPNVEPAKPKPDEPKTKAKPLDDAPKGKKKAPLDAPKAKKTDGKSQTTPKGQDQKSEIVATVPNKFALIIGNTGGGGFEQGIQFAGNSADAVQFSLTNHAGYEPGNVVILKDASASQITQAAEALAARVPEQGVVTIFFAGAALNYNGKDYLVGQGASNSSDLAAMVGKTELFRVFVQKGARIFSFFETSRVKVNEGYFGQEEALVGSIAQTYGTIRGQRVYASIYESKDVGIFAQGIANVLKQFRSNAVPIQDFAWEVFYSMRRGGLEGTGGGSVQTPTLPIITYLPAEARF